MHKYKNVVTGIFVSRPNRFIAKVIINGIEETVHVKTTGRCRELLLPGASVYLEPAERERKTKWSLIGVLKDDRTINIDSQVPNKVVEQAIKTGKLLLPGVGKIDKLKREKTYGKSRFDLYFEAENKKGFIEVKGVTLEENGTARFPDAPTDRGTKHINELVGAVKEGFCCFIIFVIQMKGVNWLEPNKRTDPAFCNALITASENGVRVIAVDCDVGPDYIDFVKFINVELDTNLRSK